MKLKLLIIGILIIVIGLSLISFYFNSEKDKSENTILVKNITTYNFEPNWWLKPQTYEVVQYGNTDYNRLEITNSTVIERLIFDFNLNNSEFDYQKDVNEAHEKGKKYVMVMGFCAIANKWPDEVEQLASKGASAVTYDGKEAIQKGEETVYFFSTNNPIWQKTLIKQAKRMVDLDVDGIAINSPWGASFYPAYDEIPDFSNVSIQEFRTYLKNKYDSQELSGIGIDNLESFNYLNYLHQKGIKEEELESAPLYEDYKKFQIENAVKFYKQFVKEIKDYAKSKGKNNFPIGIKSDGETFIPHTIDMLSFSDFAFINLELEEYYQNQEEYKLHSSTKTQVIASPADASFGWLIEKSKKPEDLIQIKMAEAYANKGAFQDLHNFGLLNGKWLSASVDASAVSEINSFFLSNKELFDTNLQSTAKIAVLFSARSMDDDTSRHWILFNSVSRALSESHFQYDILFSEDSDFSQNTVSSETLQKYKMIILPGNDVMDNNIIPLISDYLEMGGKIILIAPLDPRLGSLRDGFPSQVEYLDDWIQDNTSQEFTSIVNNSINRIVDNTFSKKIVIQLWKNSDKIIIHLVNYNFDLDNGVIEENNVPISINILLDKTPKSIKVISPDFEQKVNLDFNYSEGNIQFTVPKLKVWDVLLIE